MSHEILEELLFSGDQSELVVRRRSSGNHCCCVYHIFELDKELKRIGEYSAANINDTSIFVDREGDGILEIQFDDWIAYSFMAMAEANHQPVTCDGVMAVIMWQLM